MQTYANRNLYCQSCEKAPEVLNLLSDSEPPALSKFVVNDFEVLQYFYLSLTPLYRSSKFTSPSTGKNKANEQTNENVSIGGIKDIVIGIYSSSNI